MSMHKLFAGILVLIFCASAIPVQDNRELFLYYIAEPGGITFHWKDDTGQIFRSIQSLKESIEGEGKELKFAMNGGMYKKDNSPQGLYIENRVILAPLDTSSGSGNFYLKPNGIFYLTTDNAAAICPTTDFKNKAQIKFATQSGPMLLINGEVHPAFKKESSNVNIRNGVGILPDNSVVFAMSKQEINFYEFAEFFKRMNCKNALYLNGFVSRAYLPDENWRQLDGNFGVIMSVSK